MTGPFLKHGACLVANGYVITPIPLGGKAPRFKDWSNRGIKQKATLAEHAGLRTDGVGILTKWTPAVDIDSYDEEMSAHMIPWTRDNLGDAPLRVGLAPKALLLYATNAPFPKVTSARWKCSKGNIHRCEVLGDGQQFVALHTHPDTNQPYTWPSGGDPTTVPALDLEEITVEHARAVCREFDRFAAELGWEKLSAASEGATSAFDDPDAALAMSAPPDESDAEVKRVQDALTHISPDCSRDEYMVVLRALKWTRWLCAEELALEWAKRSEHDKFNQRDFDRDWRTTSEERGSRTSTLGSLFKHAKDAGWDASRQIGPTAEEAKALFEQLSYEIEGLNPTDRAERKSLVKRIAESELDALDVGELLKLLSKVAKVSIRDLRASIAENKRASREHDEPTHAAYAKKLLAKIEEASGTEPVGVEGKLWAYKPSLGIWEGKSPSEYEVEVAREFDGLENCSRRNDYTAVANHAHAIAAAGQMQFFEDAPIGMACEGRFYALVDGTIKREKLGHEHRQRVLCSVVPKVMETPLFDAFMARTFEGDRDREQEKLLEEFIGAAILGFGARYEKALLMKGASRAGKSTLMKIISALVPKEAISSVPPDKWSREYYLATLAGMRLNVVGELSDEEPIDSAAFKTVTGRDQLTARMPTHKPFQFTNSAAHIFNANNFIFTKDHSEAFYTRWILVEFRNSLVGKESTVDPDLARKIIETELPGVAARFLRGAERVVKRGYFVLGPCHHMLMAQWRKRSSTLMEFINDPDACVLGDFPQVQLRRADFYAAYAVWCRESNRKPLGKQKLYDEMEGPVLVSLGVRFAALAGDTLLVRGVALRSQLMDHEVWKPEEEEF